MSDQSDPRHNRLLGALADADWKRWQPHFERIDLMFGQGLYEAGVAQRHAYFPTSAVVSLAHILSTGATAEIAVVGNEGVVGTGLFLGNALTIGRASAVIAGQAIRMDAEFIRGEFERFPRVRRLLLHYTQAMLTQIAQTAVCNRHHTIDQQVCGWLLYCLDRLGGDDVKITHEVLADMLGVRRESVTQVVGRLQVAGLIRGARGHIEILDRTALEWRSCECHAVVRKEYDRLLPSDQASIPVARGGQVIIV